MFYDVPTLLSLKYPVNIHVVPGGKASLCRYLCRLRIDAREKAR